MRMFVKKVATILQLLLNNDMQVEPTSLQDLFNTMAGHTAKVQAL